MAAASLYVAPAMAADKAAIVLEPSSPWQMDYADDSCRLARMFGEGEDKSAFYIERYSPGDRFFLLVAGKPFEGTSQSKVVFTFGPNGKVWEHTGQKGTFGIYEPALFESNMALLPLSDDRETYDASKSFDPAETAADTDVFGQELTEQQEASIEWLEVKRGRKKPVRLRLGSMAESLSAVRRCTDELLTHWGLDLAAHRNLTRVVVPSENPSKWIRSADYPVALLRSGMQGLVRIRLTVGTEGKPLRCDIQKSTRPVGFDEAVCKSLMDKATFEPALSADRMPITSYWQTSVRFQIGS